MSKTKQKFYKSFYENVFYENDEMMLSVQNKGYRHCFHLVLLISIVSVFIKKLVFGYSGFWYFGLETIIVLISFFNLFFSFIWVGLLHFNKGIYKVICTTGFAIVAVGACSYAFKLKELLYQSQTGEFLIKISKEVVFAYFVYCGLFFLIVQISNWRSKKNLCTDNEQGFDANMK